MFGINYFGVTDYLVVVGTLVFSLSVGIYHSLKGNKTNEEMLVGARNMSKLPIAVSMLVTYLSAITILGYPAEIYIHGIQIFTMTILYIIFVPISLLFFVKPFYEMKLTSIYEYLEHRFDSVAVRKLGSSLFILQIMLWNSVMLYAPSIALEKMAGLPVWVSIAAIGITGTVYTAIGGIKAVVWTDCFQFVMIAIGMSSIIIRGFTAVGGPGKVFEIVAERGHLKLFDFTWDPFMRHNFWNFLIGFGFAVVTQFGTHQPQVQRYCSLPTFGDAIKSLLLTVPMNLFTMTLVLLTGLAVFATYSDCCPILLGNIKKVDAITPYFVVHEMAFIPGMVGLFVACVFSAVLSSLSSTLNSLAAVTWEDFVSKLSFVRNSTPKQQTKYLKVIAAVYGAISIGLSVLAQHSGQVLQFSLTAYGTTSGPMGGIFIYALFLPIINSWGAIAGTLVSLCVMFYIGINSLLLPKGQPPLVTDVTGCPVGTDLSYFLAQQNGTTVSMDQLDEWPDKLFSLSYLMYSITGAIISMCVALVVSLLTGGFQGRKKVKQEFLHPFIRSKDRTRSTRTENVTRVSEKKDFNYDYEKVNNGEELAELGIKT